MTSFRYIASLAVIFGYPILMIIVGIIGNKKSSVKSEICEHGVKDGQTKLLCHQCKAKMVEEKRIADIRRYETEEVAKIARQEAEMVAARARQEAEIVAERARQENARKQVERERLKIQKLQEESYIRNEIDWKEFEDTVSNLYQKLGYKVKQTSYSNDRGKDAIMLKDGKKYLLECKQYGKDKVIGRRDLQIFFAAMQEEKAVKGFFVNTGRFASTAYEYAKLNNIELIDIENLLRLIKQAYGDMSLNLKTEVVATNTQIKLFVGDLPTEENKSVIKQPNESNKVENQKYPESNTSPVNNSSNVTSKITGYVHRLDGPKIVESSSIMPKDGEYSRCKSTLEQRQVENQKYPESNKSTVSNSFNIMPKITRYVPHLDGSKIVVSSSIMPKDGKCPRCKSTLVQRQDNNDTYVICSRYPDCRFAASKSIDKILLKH